MIGGLHPCSFVDFPGRTAAVLFLRGCDLRCRYCHNPELLRPGGRPALSLEEARAFLARRRGLLGGVVVSGGEPTLDPELPGLLERIRSLGYSVKLDTNGLRPGRVRALAAAGLLDYAAVDVKVAPGVSSLELCGREGQAESALETLGALLRAGVPCEARTTVAAGCHGEEDLEKIAASLAAAGVGTWRIQPVRDGDVLDPSRPYLPPAEEILRRAADLARYLGLTVFLEGVGPGRRGGGKGSLGRRRESLPGG